MYVVLFRQEIVSSVDLDSIILAPFIYSLHYINISVMAEMNEKERMQEHVQRDNSHTTFEHVDQNLEGRTPVMDSEMPKGYYYSPLFVGTYVVYFHAAFILMFPLTKVAGHRSWVGSRSWNICNGCSDSWYHRR